MISKYKADIILIFILIITGLGILYVVTLCGKSGSTVNVRVSGQILYSYPLESDGIYIIESASHGSNTLTLKNGSACISDASCPDKLCVKSGEINKHGQSIICLPNEVVIEISSTTSNNNNDYDIITGHR